VLFQCGNKFRLALTLHQHIPEGPCGFESIDQEHGDSRFDEYPPERHSRQVLRSGKVCCPSIRLPYQFCHLYLRITAIVMLGLEKLVHDRNPWVRKTVALGLIKVYE